MVSASRRKRTWIASMNRWAKSFSEAIVFAGDGQAISKWGRLLEKAGVASTMIVGVHRLTDETPAVTCQGACGTVFRMTPGGTVTRLHAFDGTDGRTPQSGVIFATDGNLYGTARYGGANDSGTVFKISLA